MQGKQGSGRSEAAGEALAWRTLRRIRAFCRETPDSSAGAASSAEGSFSQHIRFGGISFKEYEVCAGNLRRRRDEVLFCT